MYHIHGLQSDLLSTSFSPAIYFSRAMAAERTIYSFLLVSGAGLFSEPFPMTPRPQSTSSSISLLLILTPLASFWHLSPRPYTFTHSWNLTSTREHPNSEIAGIEHHNSQTPNQMSTLAQTISITGFPEWPLQNQMRPGRWRPRLISR